MEGTGVEAPIIEIIGAGSNCRGKCFKRATLEPGHKRDLLMND